VANFGVRAVAIARGLQNCWRIFQGTPASKGSNRRPEPLELTDRFVSMSVGTLLVLKACGFIEDQKARILDVSETSLRVRTGREWYESYLPRKGSQKPLEIALSIRPLEAMDQFSRHASHPEDRYCVIEARILAGSRSWSREEFTLESKRMLWALRSYFMAC